MRVLCLDHEGGYGGSSRSLFHLIQNMDRSALDVEVWCRRAGPIRERYAAIGVPVRVVPDMFEVSTVYRLSRNVLLFGQALGQLWRAGRLRRDLVAAVNGRFDVVHFNHPNLFLLARWLRPRTRIPFTMHVRVMLEDLYEGTGGKRVSDFVNRHTSAAIARWQTRTMARCIDWFAFITDNERESFMRLGGYGPGKVIYNVADSREEAFPPHPDIPRDGRFKIASLENFRWSRGTDRLADIAEALAKRGRRDFLFIVAGEMALSGMLKGGLGAAARAGGNFTDYVEKRGLADYFLFLGHVASPEQVLAGSDVLVSLTRRVGPWGRAVIEAMTAARPVVAVGRWDRFVQHEVTGIVHERFDAGVFAQELIRLADNRERCAAMGATGRERVRRLCNGPDRAAELFAVWENVRRR